MPGDKTEIEHSSLTEVIFTAGLVHWVVLHCTGPVVIVSTLFLKIVSTVLLLFLHVTLVDYGPIIYSSKILHHSSDDTGRLGINSIDVYIYPYHSLTAGVQAKEEGHGCLSSPEMSTRRD